MTLRDAAEDNASSHCSIREALGVPFGSMVTCHLRTSLVLTLTLVSSAGAQPKPLKNQIKAQVLCGVVKDGKVATVVPTKDKRKLSDPIRCAVHLDQDSKSGESWTAKVFVEDGSPESHPSHDGELSRTGTDAKDFELTLEPATDTNRKDFTPCAAFTIRAMIDNSAGPVWMKDIKVEQDCPPPPPPNAASLHWSESALKTLADGSARDAAIAWAAAYERNDDDWFRGHFPKAGLSIPGSGKLSWKGMQNAGAQPQDIFKIEKGGECKDEEKRTDCAWGSWDTLKKGKSEFWLYNANQSGYGQFVAAVFKKSGKAWLWTAMKTYDTGEP